MKEVRVPNSDLPADVPVLALLGLREPEGADWQRLRALQFSQISDNAPLRTVVHLVCAILIIAIHLTTVPPYLFVGFALSLIHI